MCIAFWLLDAHPHYKLLLALNRDEYYSRPTLRVHRWIDQVRERTPVFFDSFCPYFKLLDFFAGRVGVRLGILFNYPVEFLLLFGDFM